jgi:hypothetical protein
MRHDEGMAGKHYQGNTGVSGETGVLRRLVLKREVLRKRRFTYEYEGVLARCGAYLERVSEESFPRYSYPFQGFTCADVRLIERHRRANRKGLGDRRNQPIDTFIVPYPTALEVRQLGLAIPAMAEKLFKAYRVGFEAACLPNLALLKTILPVCGCASRGWGMAPGSPANRLPAGPR